LQSALRPAWRITILGILIGGVAGFLGLLTADGTEAVSQTIATVYLLLVVVPPLMVGITIQQLLPHLKAVKVLLPNALVLTIAATVLGLVGGTFLFWVVSSFGAGLLGGEDTGALRLALLDLLPVRFLVLLAIDTGIAFALGVWFVQANEASRK
jgi:hypothetical protein